MKEGDFYVRKIGRATLLKMMPDFPSRLWFSTDRDHTFVYDEKAFFGDVMCEGRTVLFYGARCHLGNKDSDYMLIYPNECKGPVFNSPSPRWLRAVLYQLYEQTRHALDEQGYEYSKSMNVRELLVESMAHNAGETFVFVDRKIKERYKMPSLLWLTEFNTWYESWKKRGMPMMVRYPYENKTADLYLQTIQGDFPDVCEYPMEVEDDVQK